MAAEITQNKATFDLLGISKYHAAGLLGQGSDKIDIILDSTADGNHQAQLMAEGLTVAPLSQSKFLDRHKMKESIDWIFANQDRISSVNCSWHSPPDPEFERLEALTQFPVYAATGNTGKGKLNYPACLPWVIAVGTWDMGRDLIEVYSTWGDGIDCLIPDNIFWISGSGEAMTNEGTSFASPVPSKMTKLTGRDYSRQETMDFIRVNAKDKYTAGYDIFSGWGIFTLPELEEPTMRTVTKLHPKLQVVIKAFNAKVKEKGLKVVISETFRTKAEQNEDYAKGRTAPGNIVTNCQYPHSPHNWGVAFDFAIIDPSGKAVWATSADTDKDGKIDWTEIAEIGKSLGLEWGGDWVRFVDRPHFEMPEFFPGNKADYLIGKYGTPEKFIASWAAASPAPTPVVINPVKEEENMPGFEGPATVNADIAGVITKIPAGILDGKTYVELRTVASLTNLSLAWNPATKVATLKK